MALQPHKWCSDFFQNNDDGNAPGSRVIHFGLSSSKPNMLPTCCFYKYIFHQFSVPVLLMDEILDFLSPARGICCKREEWDIHSTGSLPSWRSWEEGLFDCLNESLSYNSRHRILAMKSLFWILLFDYFDKMPKLFSCLYSGNDRENGASGTWVGLEG